MSVTDEAGEEQPTTGRASRNEYAWTRLGYSRKTW